MADSRCMTTDPLDAAPADGLDAAFDLPEHIRDDARLVELHGEIVGRLRREASALPMSTVQTLLLERIAFYYVDLQYKERNNGFRRPTEQKDYNTFWLSMTSEFNKLLVANQDKVREALLLEIQGIVNSALSLITDKTERQNVRRSLAVAFADIDL